MIVIIEIVGAVVVAAMIFFGAMWLWQNLRVRNLQHNDKPGDER